MTGNRAIRILLLLALLAPLVVMVPQPVETLRAQPLLLAMAAERPDEMVRVIVQKGAKDAGVDELVARLGGKVTKDLHIINAFAAEVPGKAVPNLARAVGVRWVSLDAPMESTGKPCKECIDTSQLLGTYVQAIRATQLWNESPYLQGQDVRVAVVDSGITLHDDFSDGSGGRGSHRVRKNVSVNSDAWYTRDDYGHGTHVAGIIGGNGTKSKGAYIGVAPQVDLINVKVSDDRGAGTTSDVVSGLQWVYDNKDQYNIRVVNLSLNSSVPESYDTSPLSTAVEILWFNGIVVVVSAGNNGDGSGNGILYPPANDPFVITVGATDDMDTADISNDARAPFSAYGTTESGFAKPDLVAPGTDIISLLAGNSCELVRGHPDHRVDGFAGGKDYYFRMSGTSMASAVTAGAVALLLQDEPDLTPNQVKYRLRATANRDWPGYDAEQAGAGYLDIYAAVHGTTTEMTNAGIRPNLLLAKMALIAYWANEDCGDSCDWSSVNWDSVNWDSVNWDSVNWDSVNWDSVNWDSVNWDSVNWDSVNWDSVNWDSVNWDSVNWDSVNWDSVNWDSVSWDSVSWSSVNWED
jgi:serine protease AprX